MKIIFAGREEIESGIPVRTPLLSNLQNLPRRPPRNHLRSAGFRALLLEFHDAVPDFELPAGIVLTSEAHAKSIWQFVANGKTKSTQF